MVKKAFWITKLGTNNSPSAAPYMNISTVFHFSQKQISGKYYFSIKEKQS